MPHRLRLLLTVAVLACVTPAAGRAQDAPLVLEVHGGTAIPVGDLRDGDDLHGTSPGASLSFVFATPGTSWRTLYAGFSQHRFGCEDEGCPSQGRYVDRYVATGFNAGVRIVPFRDGPFIPWIRLGGITTHVETLELSEIAEAPPDHDRSDLGFGGEAGIGFFVALGQSVGWSATGLVSAVDTTLPDGSALAMRYVTLHTGLTLLF